MKTRYWVLLLGLLAVVLGAICVWQFFGGRPAGQAEVLVDGVLVKPVALSVDQTFTVECRDGHNVICVENGAIRVLEADCRGNDCVKTGPRSGGMPIVCLPHRLVIRFVEESELDGIAG